MISALRGEHPELNPLEFATTDFISRDRPGGDLADGLAMKEILREGYIMLEHGACPHARRISEYRRTPMKA